MKNFRPGTAAGSRPLMPPEPSTGTAALSPTLLREIGEALHGTLWIGPLADDLGFSRRTVERWRDGLFRIPDGVAADLAALLEAHGTRTAALRRRIRARTSAGVL